MKQYRGNRKPFCYALFTEADRQEAEAVLGELEKHRIHSAFSARRSADCIMRAAVVLLFLSPEAVSDKAVQEGVAEATSAGKTVLTVFLKETALTPGLSMQLGQTQGIFKYREESDEAFYRKLLDAPALQSMSVTPRQKKALRRRTLLWALGGAAVLAAAVLIALLWQPVRARLPFSTLRKLGVPMDFDSVETLYIYGETMLDDYAAPRYQLYADGEHDWVRLDDRLIPPGGIETLDDFRLLVNLRELCVCNNTVGSLEPILSLEKLTLLDVSHDGLSTLQGLDALTRLETLNVSCNSLQNLDGIANLTNLKTLNISFTDLTSLDALLNLPSLKTVWIDASLLGAAEALGETPFAIQCVDTPVRQYGELLAALEDPAVTDIRIMNNLTIPSGAEITVRPEVALTGAGLDGNFAVNNYGIIHIYGVWEMGLCERNNYGTVIVENGGLYTGGMCTTTSTGTFRIEKGGRQNLERGAEFSVSGGLFENNGDVYLRDGYQLRIFGATLVNNGTLHLTSSEHATLQINADRDRFVNNGDVYLDGVPVSDDILFSGETSR